MMEKTLKSIATNYGLYLGATLATITLSAYALDLNLFVNTWFGASFYAIALIFGIISVAKAKQNFNGFLNFRESFTAYFITILVGLLIITLTSFFLFNFIDTDAAAILKEKSIDKLIQVYKNMSFPQEEISDIVAKVESDNLYSIKNSLIALVFNYLLPLSVIGLLVAAAMKKSNPNAE